MEISNFTKNIHIKDYLSILRRRKWILVSFFFITVTTVTIATFIQTPVYQAIATLIVEVESPDVLAVRDVVRLGETNWWAYRDYIETQNEIIRSRRTGHQVIKNLGLLTKEEFKKAKDPITTLLRKLKVELVRDTRMLRIYINDIDPKQASLIANEFAKVYASSNMALKVKMSSQAHTWLEEEVEKQKKKVTESELKLHAYKEDNDIVSAEDQRSIVNDGLAKLNASYLDAQRRRIQVETVYTGLTDRGNNMTLENLPTPLIGNETLEGLKEDYLEQESLLVGYKRIYKHKHPKMIRLLEGIDYLNARIKGEVETEYKSVVEEENKFKIALNKQKKEALELDRKIINYNALEREVETNERMLQIVLNRLKETSISSQIQANNVRVQDLAEIPKKPIMPRKSVNMALSIVLGFIGGTGLAFFREYMDTTLKDPTEIASLLQIPVLGSVSKLRLDGKNIKRKADIDRIVEKDPRSLASEAYRTIRTNLLFSLNHSSSAKTLVITSAVPREGKTLTAVNLAIMIANGGEKVLLVDADMRKPRIHTIFNDENVSGLSQFLAGEDDFDSILRYSGIDNLHYVTSGKITHDSAEAMLSKKMNVFIEKASSRFSKIIFDTPPVTLVTDAAILSSICSGVVLVAEGGRATRPLLDRSKELLEKVDAKILGIIVNNISLTKDIDFYPQYYYGKYYSALQDKYK